MASIENRRQLERRYQRLLLAYPRRYRRARGGELLTTLLDAAPAGRRRPTWAEADLLAGGMRCRLSGSPNLLLNTLYPGRTPVEHDYNADGVSDITVFRPSNGT